MYAGMMKALVTQRDQQFEAAFKQQRAYAPASFADVHHPAIKHARSLSWEGDRRS
jgi:hypothetical protein